MTVDIYIREKNGDREIRIPWLPEEISVESGGTVRASYDIMDRGPVEIPTGSGLCAYSWESLFPGKSRTDTSMLRGSWKEPKTYINILEDWKAKGTSLTLLVTGYPINKDVFLDDFSWTAAGGFGDIEYKMYFLEERAIVITKPKTEDGAGDTVRATPKTEDYTIRKGDTLWAIAKKYLGSGTKWRTIYNANKEIIEATAKKRGMKSSNEGWWIFPGCTIKIPQ